MSRRRKSLIAVLTLILTAAGAHEVYAQVRQRQLMIDKLQNAQKLLEGIALSNFDKIEKHANELVRISKTAEWLNQKTPRYEHFSTEFQQSAEEIAKKAKAKNIDGVTLAYFDLTKSCVRCHQHIREVRDARLPGGREDASAALFLLTDSIDAVPAGDKKRTDEAALGRTREQVKMLDDLYKTAVISITNSYVEGQSSVPAAMVAQEVFAAMKKKGYHDARLIDATGKPKNKANVAKTDFEKKAVAEMKAGKTYYEEVAEVDGKPVLRAATIVPVVLKQCAVCHGKKEGTLLGTIVYELPIK